MKILYHHRTRGDGAEGVHIREMGNAFTEIGHDVRFCCPAAAKRPPGLSLGMTGMSLSESRGIRGWIRLRLRQSLEIAYNLITFFRVFFAVLRFRPRFIYERYSCYHFGGVLAARTLGIPVCLEVNSTYAGRFPRRVLAFPRTAACIERYVLRKAKVVAVVSKPIQACVADRIKAVDEQKIVVTPNAINAKSVTNAIESCDRVGIRKKLGLEGSIVIGFVGSLRRWHGVDMLLRQIPEVLTRIPSAKFLIVGSGELDAELRELLTQPTVQDRVVATGGVPHSEVLGLISAMEIGLMPHSNTWGSPMKILEYMSMEKTTIAPRLPPIEEILDDNKTGILFEPGNETEFGDAMITACQQPELRKFLGKNARQFVLQERRWTDNAALVLKAVKKHTQLCLLMLAMLITNGCSQSPKSGRTIQHDTTNIDILRKRVCDIPSPGEWWIETPSKEEFIGSLVPAAESTDKICVKRLWIPRTFDPQSNFDESFIEGIEKVPRGPHYYALLSHYYQWKGDIKKSNELMQRAREAYANEPWTGRVNMPYRTGDELSYLFSLDWIRWENAIEFEKAFERCREYIENTKPNGGFRASGYWVNDNHAEHSDFVETLLAICVCNINPDGESTRWAKEHLGRIGRSFEHKDSIYSPFELANIMSLAGRNGGGREFGQSRVNPGFGGYEGYFACSAIVQLRAIDTATECQWKLVEKSLYIQTRCKGLVFERDRNVAQTGLNPVSVALLQVMSKLCNDSRNAGLYQWCLDGSEPSTKLAELQCLAGILPKSVSPAPVPTTCNVGSRWHYREDPSKPESTFRMWIVNRDIDNFRVSPDERCMSFCIGNVGLVDAHANRTKIVGALANGVHFSQKTKGNNPYIADSNFWSVSASHHPYRSSKRATTAEQVLNDPYFLLGEDVPSKSGENWTWTRDYTDSCTRVIKSGLVDKINHAEAEYKFFSEEKKLEIVDTIRVERGIYVGWHFSPTHEVTLMENGFRFGDGKDEIVVSISGLDGTEFDVTRRSAWDHDGYSLPLDWHASVGGRQRLYENIGFTPKEYRDEYNVRVVIQANPNN